ncbi:MAG: signal peptidase II [Tropicimonas sp.]|uniref:signal peptidase II n=1 Tax=Tropicimonas sp. TaxID=2067044 RepID=UPI003A899288
MRLFWLSALLAFGLDQGSKFQVFRLFERVQMEVISIAPPFLVFRRGMNTGINFGLFAESTEARRWILIALSLVLCAALCIWAVRSFHRRIEFLSGGLIVGGALGNVFDRLLFLGVRDFLNMSCCGIDNPYVFNLADVFIFAGAAGMLLFSGEKGRGEKPS